MARIDQLRAHSAPKDNAPYVWAGLRGPGRTELDPDENGHNRGSCAQIARYPLPSTAISAGPTPAFVAP